MQKQICVTILKRKISIQGVTMKILITGFEPFNKSNINPSGEIIKKLPEELEGITLIREILPVEFKRASIRIKELLKLHQPDVVLSIGQAGNRPEICIERVAINLDCVRSSDGSRELPDNGGDMPVDVKIEEDGENAYFTNLPVWDLIKKVKEKDIAVAVSYSAGSFVCNHVMYTALYEVDKYYPNIRAGFVHVPFLPIQKEDNKKGYFMELKDMVTAIQEMIAAIAKIKS